MKFIQWTADVDRQMCMLAEERETGIRARYPSRKFKLEVYLLGDSHRSLVMTFEGNDGN